MKQYDFTHTGGFPVTQERLEYMQKAYTEAVNALGAVGGDIAGPMIVSGMEISDGGNTVTDGWFFYQGELIQFEGASVAPTGGDVAIVVITPIANTLPFFNTTTPAVELNKIATLTAAPTITDATHFPTSLLHPFGRERDWTHLSVSTPPGSGTIIGDIYYQKNTMNNTLQIWGIVGSITPSDFSSFPHVSNITLGILPVGYRPVSYRRLFNAGMDSGSDLIKDSVGSYFSRLNGAINPDGTIKIGFLKPDIGITIYITEFHSILFLD